MRNACSALVVGLAMLSLTACESTGANVGLGVLGGAAASAGGYELHLNNQKNRVEEDFKDKNIDEKERDVRLDQIKRDSLLQ